MDDSPRSSKRRKLDTPKRIESGSLAKGSATRASGRLANRSTKSYADLRAEKEEATPARTVRSAQKANNGTAAKRNQQPDIDVYDDIEGALSVEPSKRPAQRRAGVKTQEERQDTADELQGADAALKPSRGRARKAQTAGRSAPKTLVKGHTHGSEVDEESETHDELAAEAISPSKRARSAKTSTASARKAPAPRKTPAKLPSTRKLAVSARKTVPLEVDNEPTLASPSKPSRRRKPLEERTAIPDTEDESARLAPPSSKRKIASARRRANRTDNINNGDEDEILHDGASQDDDDAMDVDGNSILESVLDPTEPSPFNQPTSAQKLAQKAAQKEKAALPLIYGNLPEGHELDLLKTIVLERIANKRPCPLVGLDAEYRTVHQLIEQTVTAGEGNSMLLIGARGSGKTALVGKVLSEVAKDNGGDYHVVRLNGFIHTDDKIALREIWRQLGKEMEIEEDGSGPGKNYADTLATLLALLSHPSEQTGEMTDQVAKAVIFIIDEFDLFAQHPRQTLLYNLFDIAQSRKAPIAVLGLTTRIDVTNHLEKRVKSRFSHRYVHLSLAKTFTAFQEMCKAGLIVETEHLSVKERGILEGGTKDTKQNVLAEWNVNVNKLFATPSFLTGHLAPHFYRTKSIPAVLNSFFLPTATLSATTPFGPTNALNAPDSKLFLIPHLSTLACSLLIAAARLDIIHDSDTCNFNMVYDEYVTLASKARIQSAAGGLSSSGSVNRVWGKDVARREWEHLVELTFIMPVVQGQAGGFGMIKCDVALEEIGAVLAGEKVVDRQLERWCKTI